MPFYLQPTRILPSRHRASEFDEGGTYIRHYHHPNPDYDRDDNMSYLAGTWSDMWDEIGDGWHDVIHDSITRHKTPLCTNWGTSYCGHADYYTFSDGVPVVTSPCIGLQTPGGILNHELVQSAMEEMLREWEIKLYSFRPDQLPDLAVFVAELRDVNSIVTVLWDFSQSLIGLARRKSKLFRKIDKEIKLLTKLESKLKVDRKAIAFHRAKIKSLRSSVKELASLRLGYNFAVKQTLRELAQIIGSLYGYIDTMKFCPTSEHIRRVVPLKLTGKEISSDGGCYSKTCYDPDWKDIYWENDVEVTLTINVDFRNTFRGSTTEVLSYLLLSQLGLMPDLTSIWNATKYTWIVDYFLRTQGLRTKLSRNLDSGLQAPIITNSSVSYKVIQNLKNWHDIGCERYYKHNPKQNVTVEHYERLVGTRGTLLCDLINIIRSPTIRQSSMLLTLLLQMLL